MITNMKNKLMLGENIGRIYKSLNLSNNSMTNCEVIDGTSNKGDNKILTQWVIWSKGHSPFKRKQLKVDQIVCKVRNKKMHI